MIELSTKVARHDATTSPSPKPVRRLSLSSTIPLSRGYVTIVDDEDYEWLSQWQWRVSTYPTAGRYARRPGNLGDPNNPMRRGWVLMHREILGLRYGDGILGDHISGDTLDNCRSNLRRVNKMQNNINRLPQCNSSTGITGVSWIAKEKRYRAQITFEGRYIHLGQFKTLEEAIEVRHVAEVRYFGEYRARRRG